SVPRPLPSLGVNYEKRLLLRPPTSPRTSSVDTTIGPGREGAFSPSVITHTMGLNRRRTYVRCLCKTLCARKSGGLRAKQRTCIQFQHSTIPHSPPSFVPSPGGQG